MSHNRFQHTCVHRSTTTSSVMSAKPTDTVANSSGLASCTAPAKSPPGRHEACLRSARLISSSWRILEPYGCSRRASRREILCCLASPAQPIGVPLPHSSVNLPHIFCSSAVAFVSRSQSTGEQRRRIMRYTAGGGSPRRSSRSTAIRRASPARLTDRRKHSELCSTLQIVIKKHVHRYHETPFNLA